MASLVGALEDQVVSGACDVLQCIEEVAVHCHELITSDPSDSDITPPITRFTTVGSPKIRQWVPDQPFSQVIECLRLAREHKPDLRRARDALLSSLSCRYLLTSVNDDYKEAASVLDEVITSSSAGDSQDESVASVQRPVTMLATAQSIAHGTPIQRRQYISRILPRPTDSLSVRDSSTAFILRAVAVLRAVAKQTKRPSCRPKTKLLHVKYPYNNREHYISIFGPRETSKTTISHALCSSGSLRDTRRNFWTRKRSHDNAFRVNTDTAICFSARQQIPTAVEERHGPCAACWSQQTAVPVAPPLRRVS
ncbi:hypothetical protein EDB89DRAFT_1907477 [Lactarius sanguifluus]|nr:hypothetical protein EDB89DRAFT_1907477 [Lactarius sanguifluus]